MAAKEIIQQNIIDNEAGEITAAKMRETLDAIVDENTTELGNLSTEVGTLSSRVDKSELDIVSVHNASKAIKYDDKLPTLCGQPSILYAHGTPQESIIPVNWIGMFTAGGKVDLDGYEWNGKPVAEGQQYINLDASTNGRYIAVRDGGFTLKWLNC